MEFLSTYCRTIFFPNRIIFFPTGKDALGGVGNEDVGVFVDILQHPVHVGPVLVQHYHLCVCVIVTLVTSSYNCHIII